MTYSEIKALTVATQTQSMVLLTGMPRSGTTATVRAFFNTLFSAVVNQPAMFARDSSHDLNLPGVRNRMSAVSNRIVGEMQTTSASTIVKETTHLMSPGELDFWLTHPKLLLFVKRQPVVQLESIIWLILDRIEVGGLGNLVIDHQAIDNKIDPLCFTVDGRPFFKPGTDFSFLEQAEFEGTPWQACVRHLKTTRDYSVLGEGFKRFAIRHPSLEEPSFFVAVCTAWLDHLEDQDSGHYKSVLVDLDVTSATELISRYHGIRWEDFGRLPEVLVDALFTWRLAYFPTALHLDNERYRDAINVFDFSSFQADPKAMLVALKDLLRRHDVMINDSDNKDFIQCPEGTNQDITRMQRPDWDRFYGHADFRVSTSGNGNIKPPSKTSIALRQFPDFMLPELERAFLVYGRLAFCPNQLIADSLGDALNRLADVDPITCYGLASRDLNLAIDIDAARKAQTDLRANHPNHGAYFNLIDKAFAKACLSLKPGDAMPMN